MQWKGTSGTGKKIEIVADNVFEKSVNGVLREKDDRRLLNGHNSIMALILFTAKFIRIRSIENTFRASTCTVSKFYLYAPQYGLHVAMSVEKSAYLSA